MLSKPAISISPIFAQSNRMRFFISYMFLLVIVTTGFSQKRAVIEKFTNSHCGVCPDATIKIEALMEKYPNTIWLMHHKPFTNNPMNNDESLALWDELNVPGVPMAMVDRVAHNGSLVSGSSNWDNYLSVQDSEPAQAYVELSNVVFDETSRDLTFDINATFETLTKEGPYRISAVMVEDTVRGEPQDSYYSDVPGHPLEGLGDEIWGYAHKNVVRNILDSPWGTEGVIPDVPVIGETYTHSYTYNVSEDFRSDRFVVVALLTQHVNNDYANRHILNADKVEIRSLTATVDIESVTVEIAPNPAQNFIEIKVEEQVDRINIYGFQGQLMQTVAAPALVNRIDISAYPSGQYLIRLSKNESVAERSFSKLK